MNKSLRYTIITGANRGIGFWTTFHLLIRGEAVIMACRSKERAEAAKIEILKQIKNQKNKKHKLGSRVQSASSTLSVGTSKGLSSMASEAMIDADDAAKLVHIMTVDLSDAMSIYEFVKQIITENIKIRAIYHNASVLFDTKSEKIHRNLHGVEVSFFVNYFAPYLITELLIDYLRAQFKKDSKRINIIASGTNGIFVDQYKEMKPYYRDLRLDDLGFIDQPTGYNGYAAYVNSKLCLTYWMRALAIAEKSNGIDTLLILPLIVTNTGLYNNQKTPFLKWALELKSTVKPIKEKKHKYPEVVCRTLLEDISGESGKMRSHKNPYMQIQDVDPDFELTQEIIMKNTDRVIQKILKDIL